MFFFLENLNIINATVFINLRDVLKKIGVLTLFLWVNKE